MAIGDYNEKLPNRVIESPNDKGTPVQRGRTNSPIVPPGGAGCKPDEAICQMRQILQNMAQFTPMPGDRSFHPSVIPVDVVGSGSTSTNDILINEIPVPEGYEGRLTHISTQVFPPAAAMDVKFQLKKSGGIEPYISGQFFGGRIGDLIPVYLSAPAKTRIQIYAINTGTDKVTVAASLVGFFRPLNKQ